MRIPGFSAESTIRDGRGGRSRSAFQKTVNGVYPAMMIQVDGVDYCEGEVDDYGGFQCYTSPGGDPGYPTPDPCGRCRVSCLSVPPARRKRCLAGCALVC